MKVLIIENEFTFIEAAFNYVNDIYFNNSLLLNVIQRSQDISPFSIVENYDFVFLDISLAKSSKLDGFGILKKITENQLNIKNLIILTGNHLIEEKLIENDIIQTYKILTKPIDFEELLEIFNTAKEE